MASTRGEYDSAFVLRPAHRSASSVGRVAELFNVRGNDWSGLALGIAYMPTLSIRVPSKVASNTSINPAGFEVSVDFLEKPLDSKKVESHPRVFMYLLPPIRDLPLLFTIGGGAVWY